MNKGCEYCDYVSKCSRKCEYDSILCKINRSFPKIVDKSYNELQKDYDQLRDNYERIYNENCKLREEHNITDISLLDENYKLESNWNKLKEYLNSYIKLMNNNPDIIEQVQLDILYEVKDIMQEMEQRSIEK